MNKKIMLALIFFCASCTQSTPDSAPNYMVDWDGKMPEYFVELPSFGKLSAVKAAAYAGDGRSAVAVATYYMKADPTETMHCYWAAISAQNDYAVGQYNVGDCYEGGAGGRKSKTRAVFWFEKSAKSGNKLAQDRLNRISAAQSRVASARLDQKPAFWNLSEFKEQAYSGSAFAANALAKYYSDGNSDPMTKECYWYSIAAENGDKDGQRLLASCFSNKQSRHYSPHRTKFWLKRAASL
jgi:TPR repeat protein